MRQIRCRDCHKVLGETDGARYTQHGRRRMEATPTGATVWCESCGTPHTVPLRASSTSSEFRASLRAIPQPTPIAKPGELAPLAGCSG